jgi:hypothetical protein
MSTPSPPLPAQLVMSLFSSRWDQFWPGLLSRLESMAGPVEEVCPALPFAETGYYYREFGYPLQRRLLCFSRLVPQEGLRGIKRQTHELEQEHLQNGQRLFNLDPGLLTQERLVLATGKNFAHRIYLGDGFFADLTLLYQGGGWKTLPWTFPDYAGAALQEQLTRARRRYQAKLRGLRAAHR